MGHKAKVKYLKHTHSNIPLVSARGFVGLRVRPNSVEWTVSIVVVEWLSGLVVVSVMPFFGFGEVLVRLSKEWPIFPHVLTEGRKVFILDMLSEVTYDYVIPNWFVHV